MILGKSAAAPGTTTVPLEKTASKGLSSNELLARFERVNRLARSATEAELADATRQLDEIRAEAERRQDHETYLRVARGSIHVRLNSETDLHTAWELCENWVSRAADSHNLLVEADAHASLGVIFTRLHRDTDALNEAVTATMLLDDPALVADWETAEPRLLSYAYNDLQVCLSFLGLWEPAAAMIENAAELHGRLDASTGGGFSRTDRGIQLGVVSGNRIRVQLLWGLWEISAGRARRRFETALAIATEVRELLGPDRPPALDACHLTARALTDPDAVDPAEFDRIDRSHASRIDLVRLDIALARCHAARGRRSDAAAALARASQIVAASTAIQPLRVLTMREQARLAGLYDPARPAVTAYVQELERSAWEMNGDRAAIYFTRSTAERLRRKNGEVRQLAHTDPLTGLPNRREMDGWNDQLRRSGGSDATVALIDIDRLKPINDLRSHAVGDTVLCAVAEALHDSLRSTDSIARYGGDEFVVLLEATTPPEARDAMARAVDAVAQLPSDKGYGVTVSVGLAPLLRADGLHAAIAAADDAMYDAKRAGGNRIRIRAPLLGQPTESWASTGR
jgi:diguanylate cyclase (GGDEF)-like protein